MPICAPSVEPAPNGVHLKRSHQEKMEKRPEQAEMYGLRIVYIHLPGEGTIADREA